MEITIVEADIDMAVFDEVQAIVVMPRRLTLQEKAHTLRRLVAERRRGASDALSETA